jgi:hypothetical protein
VTFLARAVSILKVLNGEAFEFWPPLDCIQLLIK